MKYGNLTLGQVEAIVNKLGGEEGAMQFLRGVPIVHDILPDLKVWRTITLGTLKTPSEYEESIRRAGYNTRHVDGMLDKIKCSRDEERVDLVVLSLKELDFVAPRATYESICARALKLGLKLCSNEVGPALCINYDNQPKGESLNIAMEPIPQWHSYFGLVGLIFVLEHRFWGRRLGWAFSSSKVWYADDRFVFVRPR